MRQLLEYLFNQKSISQEDKDNILKIYDNMIQGGHYISLMDLLIKNKIVSNVQLKFALREMAIDELLINPIFSEISRDELMYLVDNSITSFFVPNETIYLQGDSPQNIYFILNGTVGLTYSQNMHSTISNKSILHVEEDIIFLSNRELFGDFEVVIDSNRLFTAKTMSLVYVIKIPGKYFLEIINKKSELRNKIIFKWYNYLLKGWIYPQYIQEEYYQRLLQRRQNIPCLPIWGNSTIAKKFRESIHNVINSDFILISGEQGTMKSSLAEYISDQTIGKNGRVLIFDENFELPLMDISITSNLIEIYKEEIKQLMVLFGFIDPDSSRSLWKGLLRLANNGILIIKNVESLKPKVQKEIGRYLESRTFYPVGSDKPIYTNAKIILTSEDELELDPSLYHVVKNNIIKIPPLKKRKKDIPSIVRKRIAQLNEEMNKQVMEVEDKAMKQLVLYPWPGNYRELENVIERAMLLCNSQILTTEELFIGEPEPYKASSFNLFNINPVKNFFKSQLFPKLGQIFASIFLIITILAGIFGPNSADSNVTPLLIWANWEPLLIITIIFVARIWCSICPIRYISSWFDKIGLNFKFPQKYSSFAQILSGIFLLAIFFSQIHFSMYENPFPTSVLLITILGTAILTTLIFNINSWCKYLCPLGNMVGTFSRVSILELRSDRNFCGVGCLTFECSKGTPYTDPCPITKGPFSIRSNHECIMCSNCVKACPYDTIQLNLRPPGIELKYSKDTNIILSLFTLILFATQIFRCIHPIFYNYYSNVNTLIYDLVLLLFSIIISLLVISLGSILLGTLNKQENNKKFDFYYFNIVLPIVYAIEFCIRIVPLFHTAPRFFDILSNLIHYHIPHIKFMLDLQSIFVLQIIILLCGLLTSIYVANSYPKRTNIEKFVYYSILGVNLLIIFSFIYLFHLTLKDMSL